MDGTHMDGRHKSGEETIEKGFIGNDNKHHDYVYDANEHKYHTYMTNFEFLSKNDPDKLASCMKCPMWKKCVDAEYITITNKCVEDAMVDDITEEVNKRILAKILGKTL
jgi:hypothetical protein